MDFGELLTKRSRNEGGEITLTLSPDREAKQPQGYVSSTKKAQRHTESQRVRERDEDSKETVKENER